MTVSRQIRDIAQVEAMEDDDLERMQAAHEAEIVKLENRTMFDVKDNRRAVAALKVLRVHKQWIDRELKRRLHADMAEMSESKKARKAQAAQEQREAKARADAARMERIRAANSENQRQSEAFKRVVQEELGEAVYRQLWAKAVEHVAATKESSA